MIEEVNPVEQQRQTTFDHNEERERPPRRVMHLNGRPRPYRPVRAKVQRKTIIEARQDALAIWAGEAAGKDSRDPVGLERCSALIQASTTRQVADFVEGVPGFWVAEAGLTRVYIEGQTPSALEVLAVVMFWQQLDDALSSPFVPKKRESADGDNDQLNEITRQVVEAAERKYPLRWRHRNEGVEKENVEKSPRRD